MDLKKLYPYVVPSGYLVHSPPAPDGFHRPLGHDIFVILVVDADSIIGIVTPSMLAEHGLPSDQAHGLAIENLQSFAEGASIPKSTHQGPDETSFLLWSAHWLAASCLVLPGLHVWASKYLQTDDILASVPQRESMILFPAKNRAFRDQMRAMITEAEKDARKLITWEFFSLSDKGVQPFSE